jgi:hypothetical protein
MNEAANAAAKTRADMCGSFYGRQQAAFVDAALPLRQQ